MYVHVVIRRGMQVRTEGSSIRISKSMKEYGQGYSEYTAMTWKNGSEGPGCPGRRSGGFILFHRPFRCYCLPPSPLPYPLDLPNLRTLSRRSD